MASADQTVLVLLLGIIGVLENEIVDLVELLGNVKDEAMMSWWDPMSG